jgi:hypothetical protein
MSETKKGRSKKNLNVGDLVTYKKNTWEIMNIHDTEYVIQNDKGKNETVKSSQLKKYEGDDSYSMFDVDDFVKLNDTIYKVIHVNNSFHVKLQNMETSDVLDSIRMRILSKIDNLSEPSVNNIEEEYHEHESNSIYIEQLLTRKVSMPIIHVNSNLQHNLIHIISKQIEGKCIQQGYIKPKSIKLHTYSSGMIRGSNVVFDVVFTCMIANPVEGQELDCIVDNITKAGLKCKLDVDDTSPFIIFVARDHHYNNDNINKSVHDKIKVRVIGQRFELNDPFISIIAALI